MKKQKIFLLAFILLLAFGLASCGAEKSTAPDCFVFDEQASFTKAVELEGKIIGQNQEYNLIALENIELSDAGQTIRTVEVYDAAKGDCVIFKDSVTTYPSDITKDRTYDLSNYPLIGVTRYIDSGEDDNGVVQFKGLTDYYLIDLDAKIDLSVGAKAIASSVEEYDVATVTEINNIYLAEIDGKIYWIDSELNVMRTVVLDASNSYVSGNYENYFGFDAEYEGYLYTFEIDLANAISSIIVYAPDGTASAQYGFTSGFAYVENDSDSIINPKMYVLNNGKVLIQECILVTEDGAEYDFVYGVANQKLNLVTKIMDNKTGAVEEIEFNYLIKAFESAYSRVDGEGFFFKLAEGYDNQALLVELVDGVLGRATEYVVLSNTLERVYTLKNDYIANGDFYDYIEYSDEAGYIASTYVNNRNFGLYRFDWEGNVAFEYPSNYKVNSEYVFDFYVTASGVYRNDGTLVYDIEANKQDYRDYVEVCGESVFVYQYAPYEYDRQHSNMNVNGVNEVYKVYKLDMESGELKLVVDTAEEQYFMPLTSDGAYGVMDSKKDITSVYNKDGELILAVRYYDIDRGPMYLEEAAVMSTNVGGEYKTYVLTYGDAILD